MKAKEYYEKYKTVINTDEGVTDLLFELSQEAETIQKQRNAKTISAQVSILKELNDKWNAIDRIFQKELGHKVLLYNGFIEVWKKELPQYAHLF